MNPLISIIIPVYKTEQFLPKCLDSCINQTYKNIEIIVVDDGSPGNCEEICYNYPTVKYIKFDQNKGSFAAREFGAEYALGEYIFYADPDDWLDVNACYYIAAQFQKGKTDIVMHSVNVVSPNGQVKKKSYREALGINLFQLYTNQKAFIHCSLWQFVFRRELAVNVYQELNVKDRLVLSEDVLFFICYLYFAESWSNIPNVCYYYNECNLDSATRKNMDLEKIKQDLDLITKIFEAFKRFGVRHHLAEDCFDRLRDKQMIDRLQDVKSVYQKLDWNILFPEFIKVFGAQHLARVMFDVEYNVSMKRVYRMVIKKLISMQERFIRADHPIYCLLKRFWR
ncbi:MAG: glycosyltransferase family 2 protein [Brevinemataceae bacterium]